MKKIVLFILSLCLLCVAISWPKSIIVNAEDMVGLRHIKAQSYVVVDSNGKILIEKNANDKKPVASICKLMTTLLTLEKIERGEWSLEDNVVASDYACAIEGSQAFLDAKSEYKVKDLLKSVIVASANDSAIVLAESLAGSESAFVTMMNNRAQEIGMKNTVYANSTGLTDTNTQYSTAIDTAIILNKISEFDVYREYCSIWMDKLVHPSGRETELVNTNRLIRYLPYCVSGKTGFTDEAKYCLSSTAMKNNLKLTCVVLGCDTASDRFTDSINLYNFAYANFKTNKLVEHGEKIDQLVKVNRGIDDCVGVEFGNDLSVTTSIGEDVQFDIVYNLPKVLPAPIQKGDVIGSADIYVGVDCVGSVNLIADKNVDEQKFADVINKMIDRFAIFN